MGIKKEVEREIMWNPNEVKHLSTFGCFQPLLFDTVADLSLGLAFGEMAFNNSSVAFVDFDLLLVIWFKVAQFWRNTQAKEKKEEKSVLQHSSPCFHHLNAQCKSHLTAHVYSQSSALEVVNHTILSNNKLCNNYAVSILGVWHQACPHCIVTTFPQRL